MHIHDMISAPIYRRLRVLIHMYRATETLSVARSLSISKLLNGEIKITHSPPSVSGESLIGGDCKIIKILLYARSRTRSPPPPLPPGGEREFEAFVFLRRSKQRDVEEKSNICVGFFQAGIRDAKRRYASLEMPFT